MLLLQTFSRRTDTSLCSYAKKWRCSPKGPPFGGTICVIFRRDYIAQNPKQSQRKPWLF